MIHQKLDNHKSEINKNTNKILIRYGRTVAIHAHSYSFPMLECSKSNDCCYTYASVWPNVDTFYGQMVCVEAVSASASAHTISLMRGRPIFPMF